MWLDWDLQRGDAMSRWTKYRGTIPAEAERLLPLNDEWAIRSADVEVPYFLFAKEWQVDREGEQGRSWIPSSPYGLST
jgi:hypothetical protein